jgi:two-component system CheB/CheR fusion protein
MVRSKVLVVDDHRDTVTVVSMVFEMLGCETHGAICGQDAIRIARELRADLIVLDLGLPDLDGCDVVRAIRTDPRCGAPFIAAFTGWCRDKDREDARRAGFDAYHVKPMPAANIEALLHVARPRPGAVLRFA